MGFTSEQSMMKKVLLTLILLILTISLAGCAGENAASSNVMPNNSRADSKSPTDSGEEAGSFRVEKVAELSPKYSMVYPFSDGLALVALTEITKTSAGSVYGFINVKGEEVIPMKLVRAGSFNNGLAADLTMAAIAPILTSMAIR